LDSAFSLVAFLKLVYKKHTNLGFLKTCCHLMLNPSWDAKPLIQHQENREKKNHLFRSSQVRQKKTIKFFFARLLSIFGFLYLTINIKLD